MQYIKEATKADVEDFIGWLQLKRLESFNLNNLTHCAIAQYLRDRNPGKSIKVTMHKAFIGENNFKLPYQIRKIAYGEFPESIDNKLVLGSVLLKRAREMLASMLY